MIRFRQTVAIRGGARYQAGEVAGFPPDVEARLLALGVVEAVETAPEPVDKALDAPPQHTAILTAPVKKGRSA